MKSKIGIYLTLLLLISIIAYTTVHDTSRYTFRIIQTEISSSNERDINWLAYSTTISLITGYLMFGSIHILLNKFIKSPNKSVSISIYIGLLIFSVIYFVLIYTPDFEFPHSLWMMGFVFGGLAGLYALMLKVDERYIDSGA